MLTPNSIEYLSTAVANASSHIHQWDLRHLSRIIEYTPEDMTVTVEAGAALEKLQQHLATHNQWLPVDPPNASALTIGTLLATNASGPRRFGYGTIRDHLIGLKVVIGDGSVVKSGGKVVKNVAGYDLMKLFIGSRGTLGIIVEATFKVLPKSTAERFLECPTNSLTETASLLDALDAAPVTPTVIDLHGQADRPMLVVGFAGTVREVEWQTSELCKLASFSPANLDHDAQFRLHADSASMQVESVLPSKVADTLKALGQQPMVARAGNGIIYHRGDRVTPPQTLPLDLMRRLKDAYDPRQLFPPLPW